MTLKQPTFIQHFGRICLKCFVPPLYRSSATRQIIQSIINLQSIGSIANCNENTDWVFQNLSPEDKTKKVVMIINKKFTDREIPHSTKCIGLFTLTEGTKVGHVLENVRSARLWVNVSLHECICVSVVDTLPPLYWHFLARHQESPRWPAPGIWGSAGRQSIP